MLPGEDSGHPDPIDTPEGEAVEAKQVDRLIVHNEDSPQNDVGQLTSSRITGLGMTPDRYVAGRLFPGGITYGSFEDLSILLGYGDDRFTVETTHRGTTTLDLGAGNDTLTIRTLDGHTLVRGGAGDDTVTIGTAGHRVNELLAQLAVDGGAGRDRVVVDDAANTGSTLGRLTQTSLTGLGMVARAGVDRLYSVQPRPGATSFTIGLAGVGRVTLAADASTQTVHDALYALLFPNASSCGTGGQTRCADSVFVWKVGPVYLIGFRGELAAATTPVLAALGTGGAATDRLRVDGITYAGLEADNVLDILLGSGHDVMNVQGTTAHTNLATGAGDDRIYVSSKADVALDGRPDFLTGTLDDLLGTLNIAAGPGHHQVLLISDEGARTGDRDVLITRSAAAASARDAEVDRAAEIFVVGLAVGSLTYSAVGGDFAAGRSAGVNYQGIRIWTGFGNDTIRVDAAMRRTLPGQRTTTWLSTGLGDDRVTLTLDKLVDGAFVLNTQGNYQDVLDLRTNLDPGDEPQPADTVVVRLNGNVVDPSRYYLDHDLNLVKLLFTPAVGDVLTVAITHYTPTMSALGTVSWTASTLVERFDGPQLMHSDADFVDGSGSSLPLVIFGGQDADTIKGGSGNDVILGDRGRVLWFDPATITTPWLGGTVLTASQLLALEDLAVGLAGYGGGPDRASDTDGFLVGLVITVDPTVGGPDVLHAGSGADVVIGGAGSDSITTDRDDTVGDIVLGDHGFVDYVLRDGDPTTVDSVTSLDTALGGDDTIVTGRGDDIVIGGAGADTIDGGDGRNLVAGDNAQLTVTMQRISPFLNRVIRVLETLAPTVGGGDVITTGSGSDVILGGASGDVIRAGSGDDYVVGDHGTVRMEVRAGEFRVVYLAVTDNAIGGADAIYGQDGDDVLVGGTRGDAIDGGAGKDLVFGDNVLLDRSTTYGTYANPRFRVLSGTTTYDARGNALVTGTSQLDPRGSASWMDFVLTLVDHDHDLATETTGTDRFGNDYLAGGAGDDVIFGQLGDDVIQGDGSIDFRRGGKVVGASTDLNGVLAVVASFEASTDGDDYIEGGGGSDTIFGGLGRDDIVGGSSSLFGLTSMAMRPDRSDVIFGGAGTAIGRNDRTPGHAADSDTIVGDNGNILRLVGVNGVVTGLVTYTYDTYGEPVRLLPRAVTLLDYTEGGPALHPELFGGLTPLQAATWGQMVRDVWGSDLVHGEAGDDTVYAGGGNDVVYGDAGDDDLVGGWGHDWISGGAGVDGILGDDGRILTSRNGSTEPLNGLLAVNQQSVIRTPGGGQESVVFPRGWLTKSVRLTAFSLDPAGESATGGRPSYSNDVIFGGLDSDFLHGGAGDDAISGAEALPLSYAPSYTGSIVRTDWYRPFNDGTLLGYDATTGRFALYDERDPRRRIMLNANGTLDKSAGATRQWFLNNDATEGAATEGAYAGVFDDGSDVLFGDNGNDWLVGGTGRDTLWGGQGNDLLDADDDKGTNGGLNDRADSHATYQDRVIGGAGRDILIANTGGDRLIDWNNAINVYLVPFASNSGPTIVRLGSPSLNEFLMALAHSQGADRGLGAVGIRAAASRSVRSGWSSRPTSSGSRSGTAAPARPRPSRPGPGTPRPASATRCSWPRSCRPAGAPRVPWTRLPRCRWSTWATRASSRATPAPAR